MKIDLYHLYPRFGNNNLVPPTILDVLCIWSQEQGWEVTARSANEHAVDVDTDADVVGFSVYTLSANMAYRLAAELRARGKIVILGGPHVRGRNYREALDRCDVVASSLCREQWETLLADIEAGRLEPGTSPARHLVDSRGAFRFPDNLHEAFHFHDRYQVPAVPDDRRLPLQL